MHAVPHHSTTDSQTMAQHHPQCPVGRRRDASTADPGRGLLTHHGQSLAPEERKSEKRPLYEDLQDYIDRKRKGWIVTRDAELSYPLRQRFALFEAEVMAEIHDIELEREVKYLKRAREMEGATGIARVSWKLYKLKTKLRGKWMKHWLHNGWKHSRLNAQRRKLDEEYVKAQISRRLDIVKEVIWFTNEEGIQSGDDGAYVKDGILNYVVTGYDSMFPLSRHLDVDFTRGLADEDHTGTFQAIPTLFDYVLRRKGGV